MKLKRANKPIHGLGEHGKQHRMPGLMAGEHLPQRHNSGNSDARGYEQSAARQMGAHKGPLKEGDTRRGAATAPKDSPRARRRRAA